MIQRQRAFTLIEMAVAVFIIALLLGSILVPLTTQVEQRQISDTQKALEEIKEALIGFAVAKGHLPCPDLTTGTNSNDGQEDVVVMLGTCANVEGNVPWATLGVANADPWGNRFRYRVSSNFAQRAPAVTFTLASLSSALEVCTRSVPPPCPAGSLPQVTDRPP